VISSGRNLKTSSKKNLEILKKFLAGFDGFTALVMAVLEDGVRLKGH
jgi:hypothetical protein